MPGFSVILVPTDLREPSHEALAVAASLARRGARLIVARVSGGNDGGLGLEPACGVPAEVFPPCAWGSRGFDPSLRVEQVSRGGPPAEAIVALAEQFACELIVISPPSRDGDGVERLRLSHAAQDVLRRAACPVLCLPCTPPEPVALAAGLPGSRIFLDEPAAGPRSA